MPLLEKYKWFQKGIVKTGTTVKLQQFFKTKPTEEQLLILDDIDKDNMLLIMFMFFALFLLGVLIGVFSKIPSF